MVVSPDDRWTRGISIFALAVILVFVGVQATALFSWREGLEYGVGGAIVFIIIYWMRGHRLCWLSWLFFGAWGVSAFVVVAVRVAEVLPPSLGVPPFMYAMAPYVAGMLPGTLVGIVRFVAR